MAEKLAKTKEELIARYGNGDPIQFRIHLESPIFDDLKAEDIMKLDRALGKSAHPEDMVQTLISEIFRVHNLVEYHLDRFITPRRCISDEHILTRDTIKSLSNSGLEAHSNLTQIKSQIKKLLEAAIEPELKSYRERLGYLEKSSRKKEKERETKTEKKTAPQEHGTEKAKREITQNPRQSFIRTGFDPKNERQIRQILTSQLLGRDVINYSTISVSAFCGLRFETEQFRGTGYTLLKKWGDGKADVKNLEGLLESAGYKRPKKQLERTGMERADAKGKQLPMPESPKIENPEQNFDPNDWKQLKQVLESRPEVDYHLVNVKEFKRIEFNIPLFNGTGQMLLRRFWNGGINLESLMRLLKFADYERLDLSKPEHNRNILLSKPEINYSTILTKQFMRLRFDTRLFKGTGEVILDRFGSKKADCDNFYALLKFTGIERFDINDQAHILKVLKSKKDIDYSEIRLSKFRKLQFNTKLFVGSGDALLGSFGQGEITVKNFDALLNFAGYRRLRLDVGNSRHLMEILSSIQGVDYMKITAERFGRLIFDTPRFKGGGYTLMQKFGNGKRGNEVLDALLKFAGYIRPERRTDFAINNPEHLRQVLAAVGGVDYTTIGVEEFKVIHFDHPLFRKRGDSLLRNFGSKGIDTANLDALLSHAGYARPERAVGFDINDKYQIKEILSSMQGVDYSKIGIEDFEALKFDSPLFKGAGVTLLRMLHNKRCVLEDLNQFLISLGYERPAQADFNNAETIREILQSTPENYYAMKILTFIRLKFNHKMFKGVGQTLLKSFGSRRTDRENLDNLLKFAGYESAAPGPGFDARNPENLRLILLSKPGINYSLINRKTFSRLEFDTPLFKGKGHTLLCKFSNGDCNTSRMLDALVRSAGYERFDGNDPEQLGKILASNAAINYSRLSLRDFCRLKFDSPLFKGVGVTLLEHSGTRRADMANLRHALGSLRH